MNDTPAPKLDQILTPDEQQTINGLSIDLLRRKAAVSDALKAEMEAEARLSGYLSGKISEYKLEGVWNLNSNGTALRRVG